jgi:hypothetical protein
MHFPPKIIESKNQWNRQKTMTVVTSEAQNEKRQEIGDINIGQSLLVASYI